MYYSSGPKMSKSSLSVLSSNKKQKQEDSEGDYFHEPPKNMISSFTSGDYKKINLSAISKKLEGCFSTEERPVSRLGHEIEVFKALADTKWSIRMINAYKFLSRIEKVHLGFGDNEDEAAEELVDDTQPLYSRQIKKLVKHSAMLIKKV